MRRRYLLLSGLFFVSGAAALMLQVLWTRRLASLFGSTTEGAAIVIAAFFGGLAVGNAIVTSRSRRWKRPLLAYAIVEAAVAAAIPLTWLLPATAESLLGMVERLLLAVSVVGIPAVAMGATLPALGESIGRDPEAPSWRVTQILYGANTAGGALGAALAGMLLPPWIGVRGSEILAMALLALVAAASAFLSRRVGDQPPPVGTTYRRRAPAGLLWLAAGSGALVMALEVLWTRLFSLVFHNSVYTFSSIVVVVLIALSIGSAIASRTKNPWNAIVLGSALAGVGVIGGMCAFMAVTSLDTFARDLPFASYCAAALGFVGLVAGLPALAAGLIFPSLWRAAREREDGRLGALTGVNTIGAVVGAIVAAFWILPGPGVWVGLFAVACAYLAIAVAAARRAGEWTRTIAYATAAVMVAVNIAWIPMTARREFIAGGTAPWRYHPAAYPVQRLLSGDRLLFADQTRMGTVAVVEGPRGRRLVLDNLYTLGGTRSSDQERRLGHVPLLLHPEPRRVAFIGIATGISLSAVTSAPEVREVVAIEIVPEVAAAAQEFFAEHHRGVFSDPRVRVVHGDGRVWLAAEDESTFDVIVSDLFVPWHAGTGMLYTREHFQEMHECLATEGLFALWLPLWQLGPEEFRSIAATFLDVFQATEVWRGNLSYEGPIVGLIGWKGRPRYDDATVSPRLAARSGGDPLLADIDTFGLLHVGPLEARDVEGAVRNTLDRPVVEFLAPRSHKARNLLARERWLALSALFHDDVAPVDAWDRRQAAGHLLHRALSGDPKALREAILLAPESSYLKTHQRPDESRDP